MSANFSYGLRIWVSSPSNPLSTISDVIWQQHKSEALPRFCAAAVVRPLHRDGQLVVQHIFAAAGRTYATFEVSADGRTVNSWAIPDMRASNLEELFSETVMRTILCRQGYPAFHASAVQKRGRVVLLMGPKGAGKSTLASALQQLGWTLLADDLVRMRYESSTWCALAGMRRNKLRPDSMRILGYMPEKSEPRWKGEMPEGAEGLADEKFMIPAAISENDSQREGAGVPVLGAVCLMPRDPSLAEPVFRALPHRTALLHLAEHLIRDPLPPHAPPPAAGGMLGELILQTPVWQLQLPNDLDMLRHSAAKVDETLQQTSFLAGH